jgi:hypothetical protein
MNNVAMIGICPVCGQGRLLIAREKRTGIDYIACEDCESEWENPTVSQDLNQLTRGRFGESVFLSLEVTSHHPWKKFLK